MKNILGFQFPDKTQIKTASHYLKIGPEGELIPLKGWICSTPVIGGFNLMFLNLTKREAAQKFHAWLDKRGFIRLAQSQQPASIEARQNLR